MSHRSIAALLLGSMLSISQMGCIGQMALSGEVTKFNLKVVENRWARELVFVLMYFPIPAYPIAAAIDLVIINSIEFHTGTNPISDKPRIALREGAEEVIAPDGSWASARQRADGSVDIRIIDAGGRERQVRLVPVPGGIEARTADGGLLGRVGSDSTLDSTVSRDSRVQGLLKAQYNAMTLDRFEIASENSGTFTASETFDVGMDLGSPVALAYHDRAPFAGVEPPIIPR